MEKEFIAFEQANILKELGFDEPCLGAYMGEKLVILGDSIIQMDITAHEAYNYVKAPLFQQAFRWIRKKYGVTHFITTGGDGCEKYFNYIIPTCYLKNISEDKKSMSYNKNGAFNSYEEAEIACLKKIINII